VNDFGYPATNRLVVKINNQTGLISGYFENPSVKATNVIRAVLLQSQGIGIGSYGSTNPGAFLMQSR
jgi:histidinol phosphatase-like enzyme